MKLFSVAGLSSTLLVGLALHPALTAEGCNQEGSAPVWSELPATGLSQKQVHKFDLDAYLSDTESGTGELTVTITGSDPAKVNATVDAAHILTLTAGTDFSGEVSLTVTATDPGGLSSSTPLKVKVHANRSCTTVFTYDSKKYGSVTKLAVAGQFNSWSTTANPMTDDGSGVWKSAPITIAPGYYQYKLVDNSTRWFLDPANPYRGYESGIENSEIKVEDCRQPKLELVNSIANGSLGLVGATAHYVDSSDGKGPDVASILATVGDEEVEATYDPYNRTIDFTSTPGEGTAKYTFRFYATNAAGIDAEPLYVPLWMNEGGFSWRDASIYFTFTDRFANGNTANDLQISNVANTANYQDGDFAGITKKINEGYFTQLGINTLWLSPQLDNTNNAEYGDDGRLYSGYHGYWPKSPDGLEPASGSEVELKALIEAAHANGIRVLFDLVSNHVHNQHPYWQQHQNDGWFNSYALCKDNDGWNQNPVGCWFAPYLPDIDYKNSDARHAMVDDALEMVKNYDIDGFRVDAVKHMDKSFLYHLVTDIERQVEHGRTDAESQFYLVGETFVGEWNYGTCNSAGCSQYLIKDYIGPHMLDGQFDFPLYWQIVKTFARYEAPLSSLDDLIDASASYYGSSAIMSPFLGNHDVARFLSHANGDIADMWGNGSKEQGWTNPPQAPSSYVPYQKLQLAFAFLASQSGAPLVYYGDEFGLPGAGDPDNRRMMKFAPSLSSNETQTLAYVKKVMSLRAQKEALRATSRVSLYGDDADVLVYGKAGSNDKVVVALNRSGGSRTVTVNVGALGLTAGRTLTDAIGGATATVSGASLTLTLPAYSAAYYF